MPQQVKNRFTRPSQSIQPLSLHYGASKSTAHVDFGLFGHSANSAIQLTEILERRRFSLILFRLSLQQLNLPPSIIFSSCSFILFTCSTARNSLPLNFTKIIAIKIEMILTNQTCRFRRILYGRGTHAFLLLKSVQGKDNQFGIHSSNSVIKQHSIGLFIHYLIPPRA